MTGDFSNMPDTDAGGAGRKLDSVQEIARWPEWGAEQWEEEEADRIEIPAPCPVAVAIAGADKLEPREETADHEAIRQAEPPPLEQDATAASNPRHNFSRMALGITASLLLLGGYLYGFRNSWADVPARPLPSAPHGTTDMESAHLSAIMAPSTPAITQAAASVIIPMADDAGRALPLQPELPAIPKIPVTAAAQRQPATHAQQIRPTASRAFPHRVSGTGVSARSVPAGACIRVYPQLGRCHPPEARER